MPGIIFHKLDAKTLAYVSQPVNIILTKQQSFFGCWSPVHECGCLIPSPAQRRNTYECVLAVINHQNLNFIQTDFPGAPKKLLFQ